MSAVKKLALATLAVVLFVAAATRAARADCTRGDVASTIIDGTSAFDEAHRMAPNDEIEVALHLWRCDSVIDTSDRWRPDFLALWIFFDATQRMGPMNFNDQEYLTATIIDHADVLLRNRAIPNKARLMIEPIYAWACENNPYLVERLSRWQARDTCEQLARDGPLSASQLEYAMTR